MSVRPRCPWAAVLLALALVPARAAADAVDDELERIEHARAGVRTMTARFDQERVMGLFAQSVHATGVLTVARPDRVRWEIVSPTQGVFTVAGGRVGYRAGGSVASAAQSQVGPLGVVLADLAAFLGGPLRPLRTRYRIVVQRTADGHVDLVATPLDPAIARVVERVALRFRAALDAIVQIDMFEHGGDHSTIRLLAIQLNTAVPAAAFQP